MRKYLVRDIMTMNPISVQEDVSVKKCAEIMVEKEVGSLIVMKKDSFAGILTEQDMVVKIVALNIDPNKALAKDIMTSSKGIINVEPSRSVYTAMILMNNNDIRRLPVIENGDLKGIVTMKDIFGIEPDLFDNMFDFVSDEEKENE
jgi:signal-transduction protein with cAMP-binding, CBS, and nucleotidyltransferase domain